jgi:glycerol uptake facilitator-like aquaporin
MTYFAVENIGMSFGGLRVLEDISFQVNQGEIVGLIGPNGAGKTTLFDVISGSVGPAFLAEMIGTFLLVWAIFGAAVNPRSDAAWAPWIIGGTLGLAVMIIGPLTGGSFNPARAFGPAGVGSAFGGVGDFLVAFVLGPLVGALVVVVFEEFVSHAELGLPGQGDALLRDHWLGALGLFVLLVALYLRRGLYGTLIHRGGDAGEGAHR